MEKSLADILLSDSSKFTIETEYRKVIDEL